MIDKFSSDNLFNKKKVCDLKEQLLGQLRNVGKGQLRSSGDRQKA